MRNVHFKGIHEYRWVCGDLIRKNDGVFIGDVDNGIYQVADETVSEFTGLTDHTAWTDLPEQDRNNIVSEHNKRFNCNHNDSSFAQFWSGISIYENDIVLCTHLFNSNDSFKSQVVNYKGCFGVLRNEDNQEIFIPFIGLDEYKYVVVGNVFVIKEPPQIP